MADTSGQADIRGIDIDKLAKGYADEAFVFKSYVRNTPTSAREIRWYQRTAGILDTTDTTGITASQIANVAQLALPDVVEQPWTRNTSYVRKYFVESPQISYEDIRDSDIDVLAGNVQQLTRAIANQVDSRIFSVLTEGLSPSTIYSQTATGGGGWDGTSANPILDLLSGAAAIRSSSYPIDNIVVLMNPAEYKHLINYVISTAGSSIPALASQKADNGVLMQLVGQRIVVSNNATTDYALQIVPGVSGTWKSFMPITATTKEEPGIGVKIRVWEEGEALLTDPNSVCLTLNTSA